MILDGWKKLIIALAGVASSLVLALAGHLSGLEASAAIAAIVLGHNVTQAAVDRTRPGPERTPRKKPAALTPEQLEAVRKALGDTE